MRNHADAIFLLSAMVVCIAGLLYQSHGRATPEPARTRIDTGVSVYQDGEWTVYEYETGAISECRFIAGKPVATPVCTERTP